MTVSPRALPGYLTESASAHRIRWSASHVKVKSGFPQPNGAGGTYHMPALPRLRNEPVTRLALVPEPSRCSFIIPVEVEHSTTRVAAFRSSDLRVRFFCDFFFSAALKDWF